MATYFHGAPEMQADGLQTLYLMNPNFGGYADAVAAPPSNMVLLNSTINSANSINLAQAAHHHHHHHHHQQQQQQQHQQHQQQQQFVGIAFPPAAQTHDSARPPPPTIHTPHDVSAVQGLLPRLHQYNLWRPASAQQGLSLSLSPHEMVAPAQDLPQASADEVKIATVAGSGAGNGVSGLHGLLMGSKYLKAAQQLLDEVVSVGRGIKDEPAKGGPTSKNPTDGGNNHNSNNHLESKGGEEEENTNAKRGADLSTAERQELQMKKAKLINMLEEVEQRYRQYHHQMQIVVSSFETVAGYGSARAYTALALRTISKQFRCLRDAITGQIRATGKSLGEEDATKPGGSRLRFIDHHLRQQRALQQIGMMQQNAWRPQRGLPERSVSILRAWLFEHFLHPYPKDSDKMMLAKQTGLTRSQVSNWFINARVRLWKPMVEEMYTEEIKDQEQNNSEENASKSDAHGSSTSKSNAAQQESSPRASAPTDGLKNDAKQGLAAVVQPSSFVHSQSQAYLDRDEIAQSAMKKARSSESADEASNQDILMKFFEGRQRVGEQGYHHPLIGGGGGGGYGGYPMGQLGRFDGEQFAPTRFSGNGVSLTLGLQHNENLSLSGVQPSFLSSESIQMGRRLEMSSEASDFCNLNSGNSTSVAHPSNAAFRTDRGLLLNYYHTS